MKASPNVLDFASARARFAAGEDTPRDYLERCIEVITKRNGELHAFVTLGLDNARRAADASKQRYRDGKPLSAVDGMPVGIKDIMDTSDLPTQMGSPVYKGSQPRWDAACVHALRSGGALIVGKTTTTAFAGGATNEARNPLDVARTPGGSSSGSGSAVGAGMIPVGLGTQTQGSTLRPAAYCGVVGIKPTHGALTMQGVHPISLTYDHLGVIGGTLEDAWCVASRIATAAGSPGSAGLQGASDALPAARKPKKLIVQYTPAWQSEVDGASQAAFEDLLRRLRETGVTLVPAGELSAFAALEEAFFGRYMKNSGDISAFEMRWPYRAYMERHRDQLEARVHDRLERAAQMTAADYAAVLAERAALQAQARDAMRDIDGVITLTAPGPAPIATAHTGDRTYQPFATFLGLPAFTLPLMESGGMPLGAQWIGHSGRDGALCAIARWAVETLG